ncbi:MAG: glutaredoxin 3 [Rhabdaerophilum sp.]
MAEVVVYAKAYCPYCDAAKALLQQKGVTFREIDLTRDPAGQRAMTQKANGRSTVPQIFIDGFHVGGCDDLYALDSRGGLDPLLAGKGPTP